MKNIFLSNDNKISRPAVIISAVILTIIVVVLLKFFGITLFQKKMAGFTGKYKTELVKWFPFSEENSLKEWEEKIFKGKVIYTIEKEQTLSYVKAASKASASALYYRLKLDAKNRYPVVSWQWRAEQFPAKKLPENMESQIEDDFAARVYVIFPALFFTNSKVLEYIWAEKLPVGTIGTSPYSKNIKLFVLESGPDKDNKWASEERDIAADYIKAFGRMPEYNIGAVAFMTNTEHTGTSAEAMYDDIRLGYKTEDKKSEDKKTEGGAP